MNGKACRSDSRVPVYVLVTIVIMVGVTLSQGYAAETQTYAVSSQRLQASSAEVIDSFQIEVTAGAFVGISNLPVGWFLDIDNEPSWLTKVKGQTIVGAASLTPDQLEKLNFQIQKNEFGDLKFNLTAEVSFTSDYEKIRVVHLDMTDFAVTHSR